MKNKSCFDCRNWQLCFLRRGIEENIRGAANMIEIDNVQVKKRPGNYLGIYEAVSAACIEFAEDHES